MSLRCKLFGHGKLNMIGAVSRRYMRQSYVDKRLPFSLGTRTQEGAETIYHLQCERCGEVLEKVIEGAITPIEEVEA